MASLILSPHYRSVIISMTSSELRYAFLKRCLFWGPYFEIRYGMQLSSPYWKRGFQKLLHHQFTNKLTLSRWMDPNLRKWEIRRESLSTPPKLRAWLNGLPPATTNKDSVNLRMSSINFLSWSIFLAILRRFLPRQSENAFPHQLHSQFGISSLFLMKLSNNFVFIKTCCQ